MRPTSNHVGHLHEEQHPMKMGVSEKEIFSRTKASDDNGFFYVSCRKRPIIIIDGESWDYPNLIDMKFS